MRLIILLIVFIIGAISGAYFHERDLTRNISERGVAGSSAWTDLGDKLWN